MISERILARIITYIAYFWRIIVVLLVFPPKIIYITVETQLSIYR